MTKNIYNIFMLLTSLQKCFSFYFLSLMTCQLNVSFQTHLHLTPKPDEPTHLDSKGSRLAVDSGNTGTSELLRTLRIDHLGDFKTSVDENQTQLYALISLILGKANKTSSAVDPQNLSCGYFAERSRLLGMGLNIQCWVLWIFVGSWWTMLLWSVDGGFIL